MTSAAEQRYYAAAAARVDAARGSIVDLGCWMGSTSLSLADGIYRAKSQAVAPARVVAIDRFIWEPWMDRWRCLVSGDYCSGDCFMEEVRRRVRRHAGLIELVKADLTEYEWRGGPIALLLVDAMKSWRLAESITVGFYPALKVGSVLLHQDFKHFYCSWIHIVQYRLRVHFRFVHDVRGAGTVAFETLTAVSEDAARKAADFTRLNESEIEAAFAYSHALLPRNPDPAVAAAHIMCYVHRQDAVKAAATLDRYRRAGVRMQRDMALALAALNTLNGLATTHSPSMDSL